MKKVTLLLSMLLCGVVFTACSSSDKDEESADSKLTESFAGSWYMTKDGDIYTLKVNDNGTGTTTLYEYAKKQWTAEMTTLQYTISDSRLTIKAEGDVAWNGRMAITGNSLSITENDKSVTMFTKFDGSETKINELKAEIEKNWIDLEPTDSMSHEDYYLDEASYNNAISMTYGKLAAFEYNLLNLQNIRITGKDLYGNKKVITPTLDEVNKTWTTAYATISLANTIIALAQDAKYIAYKNEALALRCLVYYNIATLWGNVPYITSNGISALTSPSVLTQAEVLTEIKNTLSSLSTLNSGVYRFDAEAVKALQGEIALCEGKTTLALEYLRNSNAHFSLNITQEMKPGTNITDALKLPNYTNDMLTLLIKEAMGEEKATLLTSWKNLGTASYGYWNMLKRTGMATSVAGCKDYELLMPMPEAEIALLPSLKQNPGY